MLPNNLLVSIARQLEAYESNLKLQLRDDRSIKSDPKHYIQSEENWTRLLETSYIYHVTFNLFSGTFSTQSVFDFVINMFIL